jgi:hypothetical protein
MDLAALIPNSKSCFSSELSDGPARRYTLHTNTMRPKDMTTTTLPTHGRAEKRKEVDKFPEHQSYSRAITPRMAPLDS